MPIQSAAERSAPTNVKVTGDITKVKVDGLSAEELKSAILQFEGHPRADVAAEIRLQKGVYDMLVEMDDAKGAKLAANVSNPASPLTWAALKSELVKARAEAEALAAHVEKTGALPVKRYAELMQATGIAAGMAFAVDG